MSRMEEEDQKAMMEDRMGRLRELRMGQREGIPELKTGLGLQTKEQECQLEEMRQR